MPFRRERHVGAVEFDSGRLQRIAQFDFMTCQEDRRVLILESDDKPQRDICHGGEVALTPSEKPARFAALIGAQNDASRARGGASNFRNSSLMRPSVNRQLSGQEGSNRPTQVM
jgi:hypothetical protein